MGATRLNGRARNAHRRVLDRITPGIPLEEVARFPGQAIAKTVT